MRKPHFLLFIVRPVHSPVFVASPRLAQPTDSTTHAKPNAHSSLIRTHTNQPTTLVYSTLNLAHSNLRSAQYTQPGQPTSAAHTAVSQPHLILNPHSAKTWSSPYLGFTRLSTHTHRPGRRRGCPDLSWLTLNQTRISLSSVSWAIKFQGLPAQYD
jgi:hypothetical protein